MITEKPSWVRHEGMQIFSIDIQAGGVRFATGGGDHKVRFCFSTFFFSNLLAISTKHAFPFYHPLGLQVDLVSLSSSSCT